MTASSETSRIVDAPILIDSAIVPEAMPMHTLLTHRSPSSKCLGGEDFSASLRKLSFQNSIVQKEDFRYPVTMAFKSFA